MNKITIIIPCRNEEKFVKNCIDSVLKFEDLEKYDYEILLLDGMSEDKTRSIIEQYIVNNIRIKLFDNPGIIQSTALNIGIKQAKGDWIMRLDAHADYPKNYFKKLIETSLKTNADNVGGVVNTLPFNSSYLAQLVQALTTHKFGVGNSGFRTGMREGEADTVPYGFFKKEIFTKIGLFDERLVRCQDYEFNCRIKKFGGKVWINPDISINYYNQPDILKFLGKQFYKEAPYNAYMWHIAPYTFTARHAITGFFAAGVICGGILSVFFPLIKYIYMAIMGLYILLSLVSSIQQAIRYKKALHILTLPVSFFFYHFIHGLGIFAGIIKLIVGIAPVQKKN